jgi:uncharacterized protein (TIRG00374 family)
VKARVDGSPEFSPLYLLARLRRWNTPAVYRTAAGVLVALALLIVFSRLISFGSVMQRLEHINIALALLCGAVFLGAFVVRALRWRYFLRPYTVSVRDAILIYQVSIFINWLLPVRGGEIVKAFLLRKRSEIPVSESLPTIGMDKLMDLLPSLVILVILPFMPFHLDGALWGLLLFVAGVFLGCIAFLMVAVWKRELALKLLYRMFALTPPIMRQKVEPFAERFLDALLRLAAQPRLLLIAAGYTVVAVGLDALFAWLGFLAIGAHVSYAVVLFGYTLYNLAYILPTPPGQIGSNEVIGLLVFAGIFHVSRLSVATMFVFTHPWTALLMIVAGLLSLSALGVGLRSTLSLGKSETAETAPEVAAPVASMAPAATVAPSATTAPSVSVAPVAPTHTSGTVRANRASCATRAPGTARATCAAVATVG